MIAPPSSLNLPPDPTSAATARRFLSDVLETNALADMVDTAQLLISEVVTNSLLHAATAIDVDCHLSGRSVLVEVSDRSPVAPSVRHHSSVAATGRGLGLVELLATDWGIKVDSEGKTVWFQLGEPHQFTTAATLVANHPEAQRAPGTPVTVVLLNLPVALVANVIEYGDAVLRELALQSMGSGADPGGGRSWQAPEIDLGSLVETLETARLEDRSSVDATVDFPPGSAVAALERMALIDEADRLAQVGGMLAVAGVPEVDACRHWLLSQITLQHEGERPEAWVLPAPLEPKLAPGEVGADRRRELEQSTQCVVVADDANRIIYVNDDAADLLGWPKHELAGRRLVSIVPHDRREAHLAGFAHHLLTGEKRLIGRTARVPMLCFDGSTREIDMILSPIELSHRRRGYQATFSPVH